MVRRRGGWCCRRMARGHARTNELIALHCAPRWCYPFLIRLRALLLSQPAHDSPHLATRDAIDRLLETDGAVAAVEADVDEALKIMGLRRVKAFLLEHSKLEGESEPKKHYI